MIRSAQVFCGSSFWGFPCFPCRLRAGCERRRAVRTGTARREVRAGARSQGHNPERPYQSTPPRRNAIPSPPHRSATPSPAPKRHTKPPHRRAAPSPAPECPTGTPHRYDARLLRNRKRDAFLPSSTKNKQSLVPVRGPEKFSAGAACKIVQGGKDNCVRFSEKRKICRFRLDKKAVLLNN